MDYAEEQRQHWNGAAGHAWVRPRCSLGCSSRWPIGSPIWQPRVVAISCSTLRDRISRPMLQTPTAKI